MELERLVQSAGPAGKALVGGIVAALGLTAAPARAAEPVPLDAYLEQVDFEEVALAPGGGAVAYLTRRLGEEGWEWEVWRAGLEDAAAAPRRLDGGGARWGLAWSADGAVLSYLAETGTGEALRLVDGAGGRPATPGRWPLPSGIAAYAWAPTGLELLVAVEAPPAAAVVDPPAPAPAAALTTAAPAAEAAAAATPIPPAGVRVRSTAPRGAGATIHRVRLARQADHTLVVQAVEPLFTIPAVAALLRPSPTGARVAIATYPSGGGPWAPAELWVAEARPGAVPHPVTDNVLREGMVYGEPALEWTPDEGALIATAWGRPQPDDPRLAQWRLIRVEVAEARLGFLAPGFAGAFLGLTRAGDGTLLTTAVLSTHRNAYRVEEHGAAHALTAVPGRIARLSAAPRTSRVAFVRDDRERHAEVYVAESPASLETARAISSHHARLQALPLPEVETVRWDNGDGSIIEGVLYWPPGRRGERGLALILDLHGGPWIARTEGVGLPTPSAHIPGLLAAHGYLVLTPNHRGSAGRGDAFLQAIQDHPCSRPVQDVLSGVDALVERGWADGARVGAMGHSWGGTLVGCLIARTNRLRAAATDAGIWSFVSYHGNPRRPFDEGFLFSTAAPWEDPTTWWRESPIAGGATLSTPTLVSFGADALVVAPSQGYELLRALGDRQVPAELVLYPGEDVLLGRRDHARFKIERELAWFAHWLARPDRR